MLAWRSLATILLGLCVVAAFAVTAPDALGVSQRLTFAYFAAPVVGWGMAFFGSRMGAKLGLPAEGGVDAALRFFGMFVLLTICALLVSRWMG